MNFLNSVVASLALLTCAHAAELTLSGSSFINAADYAGQDLTLIGGEEGAALTINGALNLTSLTCTGSPFALRLTHPGTAGQITLETIITLNPAEMLVEVTKPQTVTILSGPTVIGSGASVRMQANAVAGIDAVAEVRADGVAVHARQTLNGGRAISVNIVYGNATLADQLGEVGFHSVSAIRWLNSAISGNTWTGGTPTNTVFSVVTDNTGATIPGASIQLCCNGERYGAPTTLPGSPSLINRLILGYLNDNNSSAASPGNNYAGFQVTGVPYEKYAVIIYYNTNSGSGVFASPSVNGSFYCGSDAGITRAVADPQNYWGVPNISAINEGQNTLVIPGFTNTEHPNALVYTPAGYLPGGKRTTISGFQIVEMLDIDEPETYTATLPGGNATFSQIAWDDSKAFRNALTDSVVLTFEGDATLTLDIPLTLNAVSITCPGTLTLIGSGTHTVITWSLSGVDTAIINSAIGTYAPVTTLPPRRWLCTNPAGEALTTKPANRYELLGGESESTRVPYTVTYGGGTLCITNGFYTYTAPGTTTQTTLEIGETANIMMGDGTGNFALGKMDATISGGTITAGRLIAPQGVGNSPTTILQTGGDITLSGVQENFTGNVQPFLLGNSDGNSPSRYTLQGGSIDTGLGALHLGYLSHADLTINGGRLNVVGILGTTTPTRTLTLTGGELSIGYYGIRPMTSATFTLGGGELTASETANDTCVIRLAPTTLGGTTTTLSATTGKTLEFVVPINGGGNLRIGSPGRDGTVILTNATFIAGIDHTAGTLQLNGTTSATADRYIRLTVTDWPRTAATPAGNLTNFNTGLALSEFLLLNNNQPLAWQPDVQITANTENNNASWVIANLIDGKYNTTYFGNLIPASGRYIITIDRGENPQTFNAYRLFAGSSDGRNPLAWTLETSPDSTTWATIDTRTLTPADVYHWNYDGATADAPGTRQAKTFPDSPTTLTIANGAILRGTGTIGQTIIFEAGAKLVKLGSSDQSPTVLGAITPPAEGKVVIEPPAEEEIGGGSAIRYYLLSGPAAAELNPAAFETILPWGVGVDQGGLFLRKRSGTIITLY